MTPIYRLAMAPNFLSPFLPLCTIFHFLYCSENVLVCSVKIKINLETGKISEYKIKPKDLQFENKNHCSCINMQYDKHQSGNLDFLQSLEALIGKKIQPLCLKFYTFLFFTFS